MKDLVSLLGGRDFEKGEYKEEDSGEFIRTTYEWCH